MTVRPRIAALAAAALLLVAGCDEASTGDCGPGRQRGPDGVSCDLIPVPAESEVPADQRAAEVREQQFDDCRNEGRSEEECLPLLGDQP